MNALLLLALAATSPKSIPIATSKIIGVTISTGGYALVEREITIPAGGEGEVDLLPKAVNGTVWFETAPNVHIDSIQTGPRVHQTEVAVGSLGELLQSNVGKEVTVQTDKGAYSGKILSAISENYVVLSTTQGTQIVSLQSILSISGGNGLTYQKPQVEKSWAMDIKLSSQKSVKIGMIDLEKGASWSPAYLLDISKPKTGSLTARAEIDNQVGDFQDLEVHLVTGLPPVSNINDLDGLFVEDHEITPLPRFAMQEAKVGIGGFGGGAALSANNGLMVSPLANVRNHNLFIYRLPNITLLNNHKGYFVSLRKKVHYFSKYKWDVNNDLVSNQRVFITNNGPISAQQSVEHYYEFKNDTGEPLSGGPMTLMSEREILGQSNVGEVAEGAQVILPFGNSSKLQGTLAQKELSRTRTSEVAVKDQVWDESEVITTLTIQNFDSNPRTVTIKCPFVGTVLNRDGSDVVYYPGSPISKNRSGDATWTVVIPAHSKKSVNLTTKFYVQE